MSIKVFISYRRNDSEGVAGRLFDRFSSHFGREQIFMDVDTIAPGEDFVEVIERAVTACDVLIVVIGPGWLEARDRDERRRIDSPEDFVRVEIASALERDILVIPVLVGGAAMPRSSDLPDSLRKLARRNALELNHARWSHDSARLIETIEQRLSGRSRRSESSPDVDPLGPDNATSQSASKPFSVPLSSMSASNSDEPPAQSQPPKITPPLVSRPVNLGFDGPVEMSFPHGWFNGEYFVSNVSTRYRSSVRPRAEGHGACLVYEGADATPDEFGVVMQRCPAQFLAGKVVRLEAELATNDVEQWAGLWLRADGKGKPNLFLDNMQRNPVRGTTPWARYNLDGQLPHEIAWLNYGIVITGPGRLWADNFRLSVWSAGGWDDI